jgi:hypothetical protein
MTCSEEVYPSSMELVATMAYWGPNVTAAEMMLRDLQERYELEPTVPTWRLGSCWRLAHGEPPTVKLKEVNIGPGRRSYPTLIQPMTVPVGAIFYQEYRYGSETPQVSVPVYRPSLQERGEWIMKNVWAALERKVMPVPAEPDDLLYGLDWMLKLNRLGMWCGQIAELRTDASGLLWKPTGRTLTKAQ